MRHDFAEIGAATFDITTSLGNMTRPNMSLGTRRLRSTSPRTSGDSSCRETPAGGTIALLRSVSASWSSTMPAPT